MRQIFYIVLVLSLLTAVGTLWFWQVEGWSPLDSLYMTVITLSTVGYGEVHPLGPRGRIFVAIFLICGLGVFFYSIVQLGEMIVRAEMRNWLRRRGMHSAIRSLEKHFIVCGFGRMGRTICRHLADRRLPFVAIDRADAAIAECETLGWLYVYGDATDDATLRNAGIERARGLAVVLDDDADNLFIVLSARLLASELQIIARSMGEENARKMEKAGANRVVSIYNTGAATMAQLLVNPQVEGFFSFDAARGAGLEVAEFCVGKDSPYVNQPLSQTDFRQLGVLIVAIRRQDGDILPPSASTVIQEADELVALGKAAAISRFLAAQ